MNYGKKSILRTLKIRAQIGPRLYHLKSPKRNAIHMKKQHFFLIAFLVIFSFPLDGLAQVEPTDLAKAGISKERLNRYHKFLEREVKFGKIPGAVSLVSRKGKIVHEASYGYSSLAEKSPMRQDNIFHLMSMTKPIVTVAFMMLYEEGFFKLTDPVSNYIPQFQNLRVAKDVNKGVDGETDSIKSQVTLHQLLTHTSGFSHGLSGTELDNATANTLYNQPQKDIESRVTTLTQLPMVGQPGEQWHYSASTDVLSLLIEKISGMTTAEFLKKRIFEPLEMNDTGYNISKEHQNRWVPVHNLKEGKMVNSEQQLPVEGNTVFGGTHGLFSTAADYMKFCQMMLNQGNFNGKQLLSKKTVELMTMNQVGNLYEAPGQGFGLGFGVTTDVAESKSLGSVGQYYWGGAYCTYFFIDPKEELIAILMTQIQPYSNYYGTIMRQFIYQTIIE